MNLRAKTIFGPSEQKPLSCHIALIGNEPMDGVVPALDAAALYTREQGYVMTGSEYPNFCIQPFHGLGAMRNNAILRAMEVGADYIFIIDGDIRLDDPTVLARLLDRSKLVVAPLLDQSLIAGTEWACISHPLMDPSQGLVQLDWIAVNCILFDMSVFRIVGPRLFTDPMIVSEEDYIFRFLRVNGIRLWQDTDALVTMLRPSTKLWEVMGYPNPAPLSPGEIQLIERTNSERRKMGASA